jgi:hypothetical protein
VQNASVNYVNAATGAGGVWAEPRLRADWMRDGYDVTANLIEPFNRNVTDAWGVTDAGPSWVNTGGSASDYDVVYDGTDTLTGGYGSHTVTNPTGTFQTRSSVLSAPLVFVTRQIAKLQMPVPTGGNIESLSYYRFIDASNHYRAGVVVLPGGTVTIAIVRAVGGVETVLANNIPIGLTYTSGTQVLVSEDQMLADGTLQARAYIEGTAPPDWQVTVQDTDQILTSGVPGLRTTVYDTNTNVRPVIVKYVSYQVINSLPDDISGQAGSASVTHFHDDGFPDSVTFIAGVGTPTLTVDLGAPPPYLTQDVPQTVSEYYSPYNTRSPIYGRDRDVSPVDYALGVVGAAGPERITIFTGQMADIPVKRGQATLSAVSATRLKLAKLVQPPAINGLYQGANGTWPVTYTLAACGVYAMPPPQDGCRWWAPMHGSCRSYIPAENADHTDTMVSVQNIAGPFRKYRIRTITGPFVAALECGCNPSFVQRVTRLTTSPRVALADGAPMLAQASVGKFEAWVRGDDVNLNFNPGGSAAITSLFRMRGFNNNGSGVDNFISTTTRKLNAFLTDGTNSVSAVSTSALPNDGLWHFVGFAWDVANKKAWVNLDGVVNSATNASINPATFPVADDFATNSPEPSATLPCAELQLTTGVTGSAVSPDVGPWLRDIPFTPTANVDKSDLELASLAEPQAQEAWAYLSSYAQAELASMRTNELDVFEYFTQGHWVENAQQVVAEVYSTEFNADTVDINVDPTKIKNEILVSFSQVLTFDSYSVVVSYNEALQLPPGITLLTLPTSLAAFEVRGFTFTNIAATDTVQPMNVNSVSFNGAPDGTGAYYSQTYITATIAQWDPGQVTIQINNMSAITLYLANNKNWPALTVAAKAQDAQQVTLIESDDTSIAVRGERSVSVSNSALQTRDNARRLARRLLMALRTPQAAAEALPLFGEARRQPGDLVIFRDPSMTRVSGLWRSQAVGHTLEVRDGEISYTNEVIVRPTRDILIIGQGTIGNTLIGPEV